MTSPSLAYQDAMNGIAILYDALSNAENELDKIKNAWIKYNECTPSKDGYFIVHCPECEPSIATLMPGICLKNRNAKLCMYGEMVILRTDCVF